MNAPFLSVIVPTINREQYLSDLLLSIAKQTVDRNTFEVIIIDNGSVDKTKLVCEAFKINYADIHFQYVFDDEPGLLTGRHHGAKLAKGDILCFLDDDVMLSPDYLISVQTIMDNNTETSLLTGPSLPLYESYPPDWLHYFWSPTPSGGKTCGWLSLLDFGDKELIIDPNFVWGLNFVIRSRVFKELNGFHPDNMPETLQKYQGDGETGLTIKAKLNGYKALYHPNVLLHHRVPSSRMTFEYFDKRAFYQGVANSYTDLRRKSGLYSSSNKQNDQNEIIQRPSTSKIIKRFIKKFLPTNIYMWNKTKYQTKLANELIERFAKKSQEGYDFHRRQYKNDPSVKGWIDQDHYWDYRIPDLIEASNKKSTND